MSMQHLCFVRPGQLEWRETAAPRLLNNQQAIVRPFVVGRCDLDKGLVKGLLPMPEGAPIGHEIIGEITDIGDAVTSFSVGDVVVVPAQISCGSCRNCLRGFTGRCLSVLAALYASGETIITQSLTTWDHAERLLAEFGYPVRITQQQISVKGRQRLSANQSMDIPADFTLAFYFMVAASVIPGSDLTLRHVGVNESRCQALSVLKGMGADVELRNLREIAGEKVADICIGCAELSPFEITARQCLLTREEIPGLLVAAAFARSASRITGLSDFHQSDRERLEAAVAILTNLGVDFSFRDDDLYIKPGERKAVAAKIESCADPASLLASIVYAGVVGGTAELDDVSAICASYPGITDLAADTGINISLTNGQPAGG